MRLGAHGIRKEQLLVMRISASSPTSSTPALRGRRASQEDFDLLGRIRLEGQSPSLTGRQRDVGQRKLAADTRGRIVRFL
jgi:hypothetical protein